VAESKQVLSNLYTVFLEIMRQNVSATMKVYHIVGGVLIAFFAFRAITWCLRKANKMNIDEQADLVVRKREDKSIKFKTDLEPEKITEIITMDIAALRKGLIEKEFTSVDLVNIFGKRC
jgi:hypothetical protein